MCSTDTGNRERNFLTICTCTFDCCVASPSKTPQLQVCIVSRNQHRHTGGSRGDRPQTPPDKSSTMSTETAEKKFAPFGLSSDMLFSSRGSPLTPSPKVYPWTQLGALCPDPHYRLALGARHVPLN